jgi:hypothetical protein
VPITLIVRPIPAVKLVPPPVAPGALRLRSDVVLAGYRIEAGGVLDVVATIAPGRERGERTVVTEGEALALVELGLAEPVATATITRFPGDW